MNKLLKYFGLGFFLLLVFIATTATILPVFDFKQWYFRVFDYPRLQTLSIAVVCLVWFRCQYYKKSLKGIAITVVLAVIIVVQAYKAFPYTPLASKQVLSTEKVESNSKTINLFIANVLQTNNEYHLLLKKIDKFNPDLIITTETNKNWENALSELEEEYQYTVKVPMENTYGMHLYSKLPLSESSVRFLLSKEIPSIRTKVQLRSGEWIHLFIIHPEPPVPGHEKDSKKRDAEIIMAGKEARKVEGGVIVAGDFNDVAWSNTSELFQEVTGYLDPRRGRGFYNTFHAKYPIFRWPLDHVFHSSHFKLVRLERVKAIGSDHFPMFISLSYEPQEKHEQPAVEKEENTEEKASETIRKAKE